MTLRVTYKRFTRGFLSLTLTYCNCFLSHFSLRHSLWLSAPPSIRRRLRSLTLASTHAHLRDSISLTRSGFVELNSVRTGLQVENIVCALDPGLQGVAATDEQGCCRS
ncbi:PREDICTED: uncharacterized protein LOC101294806 [Fragaria vesca subsp. vesca]